MIKRVVSASTRPWLRELVAVALLVGLAVASHGFWLRNDLIVYGDHPGQFVRLWYPVRVSHRLLGWNPLWYAGYPELQFYPPGFVMLGWAVDWLTLRQLPPFALYGTVVFLAYLLPGLSAYALARSVTGRSWAGLVCGGLALIFAELWGGAKALQVGLVAERLAFGLVPLVMLSGWRALHGQSQVRYWLLVSFVLAATLLMHPFHALAPLLFLVVAALFLPGRWFRLRKLAAAVLLALGLVAFWLVPLAVHHRYAAPMLRANLRQTLDWLLQPGVLAYLAIGLLSPLAVWVARRRELVVFVASLWLTAAGLVAFMLFDHLLLIDRLGVYALDPVRFTAGVYLALVLLAGLGLAYLPSWLSRGRGRLAGGLVGVVLLVGALAWLGLPFLRLVREQRATALPLSQVRRTHALDATWQALQSESGRVLFTSNYMSLGGIPTSLKAATPYFTGRAIVAGTFSHWSPVARWLWVGRADADLLPERVELSDDVSLAGRPWSEWTDGGLYELCHRLNVTTIVTTWDDFQARTCLDAAPHFQSFYSDDTFVLYRVLDPAPALAEAQGADVAVRRATATALDLYVSEAGPKAVLHLSLTDYPLWQVRAGGQSLAHYADELGLMTVPLLPGSYDLSVRYLPGRSEQAGAWLSATALALWAVLLGSALCPRRFRARH